MKPLCDILADLSASGIAAIVFRLDEVEDERVFDGIGAKAGDGMTATERRFGVAIEDDAIDGVGVTAIERRFVGVVTDDEDVFAFFDSG